MAAAGAAAVEVPAAGRYKVRTGIQITLRMTSPPYSIIALEPGEEIDVTHNYLLDPGHMSANYTVDGVTHILKVPYGLLDPNTGDFVRLHSAAAAARRSKTRRNRRASRRTRRNSRNSRNSRTNSRKARRN